MSSIPFFGRLIKKSNHFTTATSSTPDKTISPSSAGSFYAPEEQRLPTATTTTTTTATATQRPKVNIPAEPFPYVTQVPWPPSKSKPLPTHNTLPVQPSMASAAVKPEPPSPQHQQQHVQAQHPESLIPARPSTSSAPPLIDIHIDTSPALNDVMLRRKSDTVSSRSNLTKPLPEHPPNDPNLPTEHHPFPDKKLFEKPLVIPMGQHLKKDQRRSSSPSEYSEASSAYSYVSAPELEYGDDDSHGLPSVRSHRLTRKDSSTLPQDLVWHLLHSSGGFQARGQDDDADKRSRRSSGGKRSVKSRRNSDGGASIHTARRSKSKSRVPAGTDASEGYRPHSRSRTVKSKHPRMSGASVSSSALSPAGSSTPSTISGFATINGLRNGGFLPHPTEPMPVHAVKTVQAVQAGIGISNNNNTNSSTKAHSSNHASSEATIQSKPSSSSLSRNKKSAAAPTLGSDYTSKSFVKGESRSNHTLGVTNLERGRSNGRTSFMEYIDSPSDDKVTLADALTGYPPITMKGSRSNANQPHVYANLDPSSSNKPAPLAKKGMITLPPLPQNPPPPRLLPHKLKDYPDHHSAVVSGTSTSTNMKKSSPPVLPFIIPHEKFQSDSLHLESSDKRRSEGRISNSHSQSQTSTTSTTTRPRPSPSRPLPTRPSFAPPVPPPVAGPSRIVNPARTYSPGKSNADKSSRKTVESDRTIKPIGQSSSKEGSNTNINAWNPSKKAAALSSSSSLHVVEPPPTKQPEKREMMVNVKGDPEVKPIIMLSDEATPPALKIASSIVVGPSTLESTSTSAPSSSTSPSSSSSLPASSSHATSESSIVERQQPSPSTRPTSSDVLVDSLHHTKEGGSQLPVTDATPVSSSPGHESPSEPQISSISVTKSGSDDSFPNGQPAVKGGVPGPSTAISEIASEVPQKADSNGVDRDGDSSNSTGGGISAISAQNNAVSVTEGGGTNVSGQPVAVEGGMAEDLQNEDPPEISTRDNKYAPEAQSPPSTSKVENDDDKQENSMSLDTVLLQASPLSNKEDSPLSDSINSPRSYLKDHEFNLSTNELRKSIHHDSSIASIPWNSSTGSVGSHRFKNEYYLHHPSSIHPEHYPLPPSSSSVGLVLPDDHPRNNEPNRPSDGRTSSPNVFRQRPFSPESVRSFSSHPNIDHRQNPSAGDLSQAMSGGPSEAAKTSSFFNQQRPSSRTSSAFMSVTGTRAHRSSTLPTVDGVSPAPSFAQSNRNSKSTLPIGGVRGVLNESTAQQATRQRSGSEPQPNTLYHRVAASGRLSTIQQSPIQVTRPAALPLRGERTMMGSMTFPETPYEYTPIPTPGTQNLVSPHAREASFPSNGYKSPRKPSRLGSDASASLRRPVGPRPQRNASGPSGGGGGVARNASSRVASPPTTPRSFDLDPGVTDGGVLPDFRPRPVEWRAYTLEAAQWTFTSEQLQEIVGQAIRQSAIPSTVRLLSLNAIDEIKPEIERLEILQHDVTIRYCANVTRRRVILKSLKHHLMDADWTKRSQLLQELNDTSYLADQLTKDLFHTMYRLQQLYRLRDVHNGSALAMALRKLNSSFVKQLDEMTQLSQYILQLEEEKEEAWATAERFEGEAMELREKLEAMSAGTASEDSSRRSSARKRSVRASKASFRLSRSTRLSHSSTNSNINLTPPPPVPPIPRITQTPNSRILSLNTDVSLGPHSIQSAQSLGFSASPTPESRAMAQAQRELYDLLGFSGTRRRRSIPSRTRPLSEILSPVTATDGPMSPHRPSDHLHHHHHLPPPLLRRNNSIPISPYIISENFRD